MMGSKERHFAPLINLSLEELVPQDHFYRHLERTLDLFFVREFVHETYAGGGRPSIDPVGFFKLQLVMFFEAIRSERLLMRQAADRLSILWYLGYELSGTLAGSFQPFVEAHLAHLFSSEAEEESEQGAYEVSQEEPPRSEQKEPPVPSPLPTTLSLEEDAALAQHNEERHDWIEQGGKPDREVMRGTYRRMADFVVSTTDPDASIMPIKGQGRHLGYHTHYVVDGGKARIIMTVLVTPSEVMENQPMLDLVFRTRFRWNLWPRQVTGDTTYGTVDNIVALEHEHIRAYVPFPDFDQRTPFYGQREFQYDPALDVYTCPNGALLHLEKHRYTEQTKEYRADAATCNACPLKAYCTDSERGRSLRRSFDEEYLEQVRAYHTTEPYHKAMRKRSVWVEPL
jgi:hypothetical protein